MSSWRNSNNKGQSSSSTEMQDECHFDQEDSNNFTYPDPAVHSEQAFQRHPGTYRRILPRRNGPPQTRSPNPDVIQRDSYHMPEPMQQSTSAMHNFGTEQIGWGNQYNALYFRNANMPSQTTNTALSQNINTQGYPSTSATQHISSLSTHLGYNSGYIHHTNGPSPYQTAPPGVTPGLCYPVPQAPPGIANDNVQAERVPRYPRPERPRADIGPEAERLAFSNRHSFQTQPARDRRSSSTTRTVQQAGRSKPQSAARRNTVANGRVSKHGQKKQRPRDSIGYDRRERAPIRRMNGALLGLVDDEWVPAGYHGDFREQLIRKAAQQPGAPVWDGTSTDYTSYSPLTHRWSNEMDVSTVRDSKGRQVFLMPDPPADYTANPKCDYMKFEGLYLLDDNNRPIKDYPGAPLTLSTQTPACVMEGLRRVLGMTIFNEMARMPSKRETKSGPKDRQQSTAFSNRIDRWMKLPRTKSKGVLAWFEREKGRGTEEGVAAPSDESDEEADPTDFQSNLSRLSASQPGLPVAVPATNSITQHGSETQSSFIDPQLLLLRPDRFSMTTRQPLDTDLNSSNYPDQFWSSSPGTSAAIASRTGQTPPAFDPATVDWNDPIWDIDPESDGSHP